MITKRNGKDLVQLISLAKKGILDFDYVERWDQFKREWSEEDVTFWNGLKSRMTKDEFGALKLDPPLSKDEKLKAKMLIKRAEDRDLC